MENRIFCRDSRVLWIISIPYLLMLLLPTSYILWKSNYTLLTKAIFFGYLWVFLFFVIAIIEMKINRPLREITRANMNVASGNLDYKPQVNDNEDCIGGLVATFNLMREGLIAWQKKEAEKQGEALETNQNLKKRIEILSALFELEKAISSASDIGNFLQVFSGEISRVLNAEVCLIGLYENFKERSNFQVACRGIDKENKGELVKIGEDLVNRLSDQMPHTIKPTTEDFHPLYTNFTRKHKVNSIFAVPLIIEGKVAGTIALCASSQRAFTTEETQLLFLFANQIGVAVRHNQMHKNMERLAINDGLTGLYNYRFFRHTLNEEIQRAKRYHYPISVILLDLDRFQKINEQVGHLKGDLILLHVAQVLKDSSRRSDIVARYGGEEFIMALPFTAKEGAIRVAERIRKRIQQVTLGKNEPALSLTASAGVSTFIEDADNPEMLIDRADQLLYQAKELGRNRVCFFGRKK